MQTMGEPQAWLANYRLAREFDQVTLTSCRRNKGTELPNSRKREIQTHARCAHTMHNPQVTFVHWKIEHKDHFRCLNWVSLWKIKQATNLENQD